MDNALDLGLLTDVARVDTSKQTTADESIQRKGLSEDTERDCIMIFLKSHSWNINLCECPFYYADKLQKQLLAFSPQKAATISAPV